jgi:hypothetical protein
MIRIDEIYENTFLPWVRKNCPDTAIFYCDPFGRSDPDSILCRGLDNSADEKQSIFFFDQEPVQLSIHLPTFLSFNLRNNLVLNGVKLEKNKFLVTSETNSDNVDYICKAYELQPFYYFFHGWAALDWYRGYDRTFLITPPDQRHIKKTFFSANRIIGGERSHRVIQLYYFQLYNLMHNYISAPKICPVENKDIIDIAKFYRYKYPENFSFKNDQLKGGIIETISNMDLPKLFPGEDTQRMSSCWLDQFDLCAESLVYHVSETVFFGRRQHLTEKTFKPIAMGMPFVLSAPAGSLEYLRQYGFKTFDSVWSEQYDIQKDDHRRIFMLTELLLKLDQQSEQQKNDMFKKCIPIIEHNWNHFYKGGFEKVLWAELSTMLNNIKAATQGDLSSN